MSRFVSIWFVSGSIAGLAACGVNSAPPAVTNAPSATSDDEGPCGYRSAQAFTDALDQLTRAETAEEWERPFGTCRASMSSVMGLTVAADHNRDQYTVEKHNGVIWAYHSAFVTHGVRVGDSGAVAIERAQQFGLTELSCVAGAGIWQCEFGRPDGRDCLDVQVRYEPDRDQGQLRSTDPELVKGRLIHAIALKMPC